jgi:uncharacterized protein YdaU (DUF1376 family)
MSGPKARRVDYSPDEYLAGIAGKLTPDEQGVYWLICTLIYSRGGPIEDDAEWLSRFFARTRARHVRKVVDHLVSLGKISRQYHGSTALLTQQRALTELIVTAQRMVTARKNGAKGGRPSSNINGLKNPGVFPWVNQTEKLSTTTTTTTKEEPLTPDAQPSQVEVPREAVVANGADTIQVTDALRNSKMLRKAS